MFRVPFQGLTPGYHLQVVPFFSGEGRRLDRVRNLIQEKARFAVGWFCWSFLGPGVVVSKPWDEWIFCWCLLGVLFLVLRFGQIVDDVGFFVVKVCMLILNFSGTIHKMFDTYEFIMFC